jgi:Catalytic LigB subunit of aromatic ring-opening dioxygenase
MPLTAVRRSQRDLSVSEIVLGIGTSHTPLLTLDSQTWALRASDDIQNPNLNLSDGRFVSYAQLLAETGEKYTEQATFQNFDALERQSRQALDRLADEIERAAPDVAIIIGDDHEELFKRGNMPGLAIFYGRDLVMHPALAAWKNPPGWVEMALRGYAMDAAHRFAGAAEFATQLIEKLMDKGVDVSGASNIDDPAKAGLGHAFGFVIHRLFRGRTIPVVPVLLNTYYPPNVVRPSRCYDVGRLLRQAIEEIDGPARVVIIGSGGLSHFVTDEALDRGVLDALRTKDAQALRSIPMAALNSGSSEILCWVMAAGALESLDTAWSEYFPVYRTPAGTGIGLGFVVWRKPPGKKT